MRTIHQDQRYIVVDDHNADNRRAIWGSCSGTYAPIMKREAAEAGYKNAAIRKYRRNSYAYGVRRAS